jgi:hypothetical protein
MMKRVVATSIVTRRSITNSSSCNATIASNITSSVVQATSKSNTIRLSSKRYLSSDDYRKIGASVPIGGGRSGGIIAGLMNAHGSQFFLLTFPLVIVSGYFALYPSDMDEVESAIREKYEKDINEISTASTILDQHGAPNSAKALEREKNFQLFYQHSIKGMGHDSSKIKDEKERANVIEMEQKLQSVLLGGKEEAGLNQNMLPGSGGNDNVTVNATASDATIVLSKTALINDGQSRNPYSKATLKQQQVKQKKKNQQQLADASVTTPTTVEAPGTEKSSTSTVTNAVTVGLITTATIALALVAGGSSRK